MTGRRVSREDGMTLVEVLVAALILVLGITTTVSVLNSSRRLTLQSERKEQALSYAQSDAEGFRSLKYENVATQALPASGLASDASALVITVGGTQVVRVKPLDALLTGYSYQRLAPTSASGVVQSEPITIGNSTGTVSRVVSYEESCALATVCTGTATAKRVTVRVQLNAVNGSTPAPVISQTVIAKPDAT